MLRIKDRLRLHVFGKEDRPLLFTDLGLLYELYKDARTPEQRLADYQALVAEQLDLRALRNGYLHWSANHRRIGMGPRIVDYKRLRQEYLDGEPLK